MSDLPQVYRNYELLFTPPLIPLLRDLRGEKWARLIDDLSKLPPTHPAALGFSMMMIELGGCLSCQMDSYRAQRGCAACARQTILSFKGSDAQLFKRNEQACQFVRQQLADAELKRAA
jgi:hypothetical protein